MSNTAAVIVVCGAVVTGVGFFVGVGSYRMRHSKRPYLAGMAFSIISAWVLIAVGVSIR